MRVWAFVFFLFPTFLSGQTTLDTLLANWRMENLSQSEILIELNSLLQEENYNGTERFNLNQEYLNQARSQNKKWHICTAHALFGRFYLELSDYDLSIQYYEASLELSQSIADTTLILSNYVGLIDNYQRSGDMKLMVDYQIKTLDLIKNSQLNKENRFVIGNLGATYLTLLDFNQSKFYSNIALNLSKQAKDTSAILTSYYNIGQAYAFDNSFDTSLIYYDSIIAMMPVEMSNPTATEALEYGELLSNMAYSNFGIGNITQGERLAQKALSIQYTNKDKFGQSRTLYLLSQYSENAQKIQYAKDALLIAQEIGSMYLISDISQYLYAHYKENGQMAEALEMLELSNLAKEALNNESAFNRITEYKYKERSELEKKSIEADLKDQELKSRSYLSWMVSGSAMVLILLLIFIRRLFKHKHERGQLLLKIEEMKNRNDSKEDFEQLFHKKEFFLDQNFIESLIDGKLNESDWRILENLYSNPAIPNKELANAVSLSVEGVRSSLRKMYRLFEITTSRNMKLALILKISERISSTNKSEI